MVTSTAAGALGSVRRRARLDPAGFARTASTIATLAGYVAAWRLRRRSHRVSAALVGVLAGMAAPAGAAFAKKLAAQSESETAGVASTLVRHLGDLSVAAAESCTAGRVASSLAAVEGASDFLVGSIVAYDEQIKRDVLGVQAPSVYSEQAAMEMALGACRVLDADAAVSTTGVAGDVPQDGVPPGAVFIGTAVLGTARAQRYHFGGTPEEIVAQASDQALLDLDAAVMAADDTRRVS